MKKLLLLLSVFTLSFTLTACEDEVENLLPETNEEQNEEQNEEVVVPTEADYENFKSNFIKEYNKVIEEITNFDSNWTLDEFYEYEEETYPSYLYNREDSYLNYFIVVLLRDEIAIELGNALKEAKVSKTQLDVLSDNLDVITNCLYEDSFYSVEFIELLLAAKLSSEQIIVTIHYLLSNSGEIMLNALDNSKYKNQDDWAETHLLVKEEVEEASTDDILVMFASITEEQLAEYIELGSITFDPVANYLYGLESSFEMITEIMESGNLTENQLSAILKQNATSFKNATKDLTVENITTILNFTIELDGLMYGYEPNITEEEVNYMANSIMLSIRLVTETFDYLALDENSSVAYNIINDAITFIEADNSDLTDEEEDANYELNAVLTLNLLILSSKVINNVIFDEELNELFDELEIDVEYLKGLVAELSEYEYFTECENYEEFPYLEENAIFFEYMEYIDALLYLL